MVPIEGNPDLAVNGNTMPDKFEDYYWKSTLKAAEDIFVTSKEMTALNIEPSTMYFMTNST